MSLVLTHNQNVPVVSGPGWLENHVFTGGNTGSLLVRDTSVTTYGADWLQSVSAGKVLASAGAGALPVWSSTPYVNQLGVGNQPNAANGPALLVRSNISQPTSDRNSALVIQAAPDNPAGGDKVYTFLSANGTYYSNTALILCGNVPYCGTIDGTGSFTINGTLDPNVGTSSMLSIGSDTTVGIICVTSSAVGAWNYQARDANLAFVHSIEADGQLQFGASGTAQQGGAQTHAAMDTYVRRAGGVNSPAGQNGIAGYVLVGKVGGTGVAGESALVVGPSATDCVGMLYGTDRVILRRINAATQPAVVDFATIAPQYGAPGNFTIKNAAMTKAPLFVDISGTEADNTLVVAGGRVGVGTSPLASTGSAMTIFDISSGSGFLHIGNNSFGSDWFVFNLDASLSSTKYALAFSNAGAGTTILNCQSGGSVDLRIANASKFKVDGSTVTIANGSVPSADPHVVGQLFRSGTALQISQG